MHLTSKFNQNLLRSAGLHRFETSSIGQPKGRPEQDRRTTCFGVALRFIRHKNKFLRLPPLRACVLTLASLPVGRQNVYNKKMFFLCGGGKIFKRWVFGWVKASTQNPQRKTPRVVEAGRLRLPREGNRK